MTICTKAGLGAALALLVAGSGFAGAAVAAPTAAVPKVNNRNCVNTASFDRWLTDFRRDAATAGIKPATLVAALDGMTIDQTIIQRDRGQGFFAQSFLSFSDKLASRNRMDSGQRMIEKHRALFDRAEKQYGVPPAVLAAFWALESDFGLGMGKLPVLRSLATLAYDCRRGEMFRAELLDALRIIDRGDLRPADMIGSWAGELGQTQFLPSHYHKHAVDWDGDGRRDLFKSIPDIIGSSAAFVASLGWQRGEPWLEEVRLPASLPWEQADLAVRHPRAKWAGWGVTRADGRALGADAKPASLLLLMGRNGPAFLVYDNFKAYTEWNQSLNYATTAAYLATRIAGSPPMGRGNAPVPVLEAAQLKELQTLLARQGHDIGEIDGRLGAATRGAIRKAQTKLGQPADSYPTVELIDRLRGGAGAGGAGAARAEPRAAAPARPVGAQQRAPVR